VALDRQRIVAEAVALLDADGLDAVTLRKLARRLGVQAALVTAIAEEILEQQFPETYLVPPEPERRWQDWLAGLAQRLRQAMLAHPDGARVVSASHLCLKMAAISELAMSTLVARGLPLHQARLLVLTVRHHRVLPARPHRRRPVPRLPKVDHRPGWGDWAGRMELRFGQRASGWISGGCRDRAHQDRSG
jgi:AcrR family transcriptional regulator